MSFFDSKRKVKIICIMLTFVIAFMSIIPSYSMAASDPDEKEGGTLFKPVFRLFAGIGDLVVKGLQKIFVGDGDIKIQNPRRFS